MQTVNLDTEHSHLSDEQLDQYRAGLLDDEPQTLTLIESHLAECSACQRRQQQWDVLAQNLRPTAPNETLEQTFESQRRDALQAHRRKSSYLPAIAIAASVFFAIIGVSVFTVTQPPSAPTEQQIAVENTEILDDIDFYIWLSQNQSENISNEGNT